MLCYSQSGIRARYACLQCKKRKRKCDKFEKGCSTCLRLGCRCTYGDGKPAFLSTTVVFGAAPESTSTAVNVSRIRLHDWRRLQSQNWATANVMAVNIPMLGAPRDVDTVQAIHESAAKYFHSVHEWLPIVSRRKFYDALFEQQPTRPVPEASCILLGYAMQLVVQPRPLENVAEHGKDSLYNRVKRLLFLSDAEAAPCLRRVQARLLLATYEFGHGMHSAAYLSIGACARMAIDLGLDKSQHANVDNDDDDGSTEERRRVWCGIVILDRCISLAFPNRPNCTGDPGIDLLLPTDDGAWDTNHTRRCGPVPMSTGLDMRIGPFGRQAQVAHLLGRVVTHIMSPTDDADFNQGELFQLEQTLVTFLTNLPQEDAVKPCSAYCGAMGMCVSALLFLHTGGPLSCTVPQDSLRITSHYVAFAVERAQGYLSSLDAYDMESLSPLTPYALHLAYTIHHKRLWLDDGRVNQAVRQQLDLLANMLKSFGQRWRHAYELYLTLPKF